MPQAQERSSGPLSITCCSRGTPHALLRQLGRWVHDRRVVSRRPRLHNTHPSDSFANVKSANQSLTHQREAAAELGGSAAAYHVDRMRAGLAPPFFSNPPPDADSHTRLWCVRPHSVIPRPDGHPTWFVVVSAAIRIGSRTDPSHCTPRRQIGVGVARDWPHLSGPGRSPGSRTA